MKNHDIDTLFSTLVRVGIAVQKPHLRQKDLAAKLGVSEASFTRMLLGQKEISREAQIILTRELKLGPLLRALATRLEEG
jgi:putative heme degradation protein